MPRVIVVGGGPAGMMAAITAAENGNDVTLIEKMPSFGKKLLKIKVVSSDKDKLTTNNYVIRALIINSILVDLIGLTFVVFGNVDAYFYSNMVCGFVRYGLLLTCAFMVMWSKSGMGLHDRLAHTMVVKA